MNFLLPISYIYYSIPSLLRAITKRILLFSLFIALSYTTKAENTFLSYRINTYQKNYYPPTYRRSFSQSSFFRKNSTPSPKIRKRPPVSLSRKRQRTKPLFIALNDIGTSIRKNIQQNRISDRKTSFYNQTYPLKKTHQTATREKQHKKKNSIHSSRNSNIHLITKTSVAIILAPVAIPYLLLEKVFSHTTSGGEISIRKTKPVSISRRRTKSQPLLTSLFALKKKKNTLSPHRNKNLNTEVAVYKRKMQYKTTAYSHTKQDYKNTRSQSYKFKSIFLTSSSVVLAPVVIPYILVKKIFEKNHHISREKSHKRTEPVSISRKRTKAPPIFISFHTWKQKTIHTISRGSIKNKHISPLDDRVYSSQNTNKNSKSKSILFYSSAVIVSPIIAPYLLIKKLYNQTNSSSKQKTFTKNEHQSNFYKEVNDVKWSLKSLWKGLTDAVKRIRKSPYDRGESAIWYK
ncbi:MAG: hypothetical protein QM536_00140 [Chitinophagaceae bacterium]|nr:hypothetical protein [Chitinophagaceae bacterium]